MSALRFTLREILIALGVALPIVMTATIAWFDMRGEVRSLNIRLEHIETDVDERDDEFGHRLERIEDKLDLLMQRRAELESNSAPL